ncbi:putative bifunctional diguanylate cyclase/phosphodiesterase [Allohahella marinimesophila]|uniref:EAL domain-containing protein n=1 Tax=Allohahella marinimesophila TaxID=1054972 RepID=A0ABP7NTX5_9GAMM
MTDSRFHSLLARQLERLAEADGVDAATLPTSFLQAVNEAYLQHDEARRVFERTIDLSNRDLEERYELLEKQHKALDDSTSQLKLSHALLYDTLNSTKDAVVVLDLKGNVIIHNKQFRKMFGVPAEATPLDKHHIRSCFKARVENLDELTSVWNFNKQYPAQTSRCMIMLKDDRFVECYTIPRLRDGETIGRVWSFSDITEIKRSEQLAVHNSHHDALTGLPNRNLLTEWLKREAAREPRDLKNRKSTAVLFIGVDGFKVVNELQGVEFGDRLLCLIAQRLTNACRGSALARHGGDEFVVLAENLGDTFQITLLAEEILQQISQPFMLSSQTIHISVSIGIALFPGDGQNPETLLRKSNIAMFHAKQKGRNNFQFFADQLELMAHHRLQLRNDLRRALTNQEFRLVYQPKIDLATREIRGAEALIRWQPANGDPISPAQFIPSAEENGFIVEIGEWVIDEVGRQLAEWREQGRGCPVALNISTKHFQLGDLVGSIKQMIERYNIEPDLIEIEVTESAFIEDMPKTALALTTLRAMGVLCSIDDFGTGFSSLSYLLTLPIDILKIDKIFVDNATQSAKQQALLKTIVELAHALDIRVVAEGIEDEATGTLLHQLHCDMAQGFYFSRPLPPETFHTLLLSGGSLPHES